MTTQQEILCTMMTLLNEASDKIPEGLYLQLCDHLKNLHNINKPHVRVNRVWGELHEFNVRSVFKIQHLQYFASIILTHIVYLFGILYDILISVLTGLGIFITTITLPPPPITLGGVVQGAVQVISS